LGKNKLARFAVNAQRRNVIEPGKELFTTIKGNWRSFFGNNNPLYLELACGRGEYTTGMAAVYPQHNYVGVDVKGARIWKGSTVAVENKLDNAAFLRIKMYQIEDFFEPGEVDGIWLTFPDPRPRDRDEKHRLTYIKYLRVYRKLLAKDGMFFFKTDNAGLFDYTLEILEQYKEELGIRDLEYTKDLYDSPYLAEHHGIQTTYEKLFMKDGCPIKYMKFRFGPEQA
jgi:tRNA (guanine-N7-)-methyltransferase